MTVNINTKYRSCKRGHLGYDRWKFDCNWFKYWKEPDSLLCNGLPTDPAMSSYKGSERKELDSLSSRGITFNFGIPSGCCWVFIHNTQSHGQPTPVAVALHVERWKKRTYLVKLHLNSNSSFYDNFKNPSFSQRI